MAALLRSRIDTAIVHEPARRSVTRESVAAPARNHSLLQRRTPFTNRWVTLAALALLAGCSGDSADAPGQGIGRRRSSPGAIELTSVTYRPGELRVAGTIVGTVEVDGDPPADSVVTTTSDQAFCGSTLPDSSIIRRGSRLANVVVWLADVKEGKRLPVERRTEIINDHCQLDPRVQAVVAGTTVNVRNEDRLSHTTWFTRADNNDSLATIPLTDDGQVVPNEHIAAKSGLVAVRCAQHPWTRGYIAVFENPYFAVTDTTGTFRLDSVPSGKYRLRAWHERARREMETAVEVTAATESKVELKFRLR